METILQKRNSLQNRHITQLQHQKSKETSAMEKNLIRLLANEAKTITIKALFLSHFGDKNSDIISVSIVVSIPYCHSGDRVLIPRQRERFDELRYIGSGPLTKNKSKLIKKGYSRQKNN